MSITDATPLAMDEVDPELACDFALNAPELEPKQYSEEDIARRIRALRFKKRDLETVAARFDRELERVSAAKDAATKTLRADIESLTALLAGWYRVQPVTRAKSMVFPDGTLRSRSSSSIELVDDDTELPEWAEKVTTKTTTSLDKKAVKSRISDGSLTLNDDGRCIDSTGELLPFAQVVKVTHTVETEPVE